MNVFIIQPNYRAVSETWLYRMNSLLSGHICGMAAYLHNEVVQESFPVFNLNGRRLKRLERYLVKAGVRNGNVQDRTRKELGSFIRSCGSDVLLVHYATVADDLWQTIKTLSIPVFIYVHGFDIIWDHNDNHGQRLHDEGYGCRVLQMASSPNVSFIVSSECSRKNLLALGIRPEKIWKKIFGVKLPEVQRNYNKESLMVLYLGRFIDFKGPDIVLSAFLSACESGFKGRLVMAGDGPLRVMCELIARRSKFSHSIAFTGEIDQVQAARLFEEADIYSMHNSRGVLSNGYDTFGVTIIEAMSFGLPVITANVGGPIELIENGKDGILVEANDTLLHADAFMALFNDRELCRTLGENARKKVENTFNPATEKEELFGILKMANASSNICVAS